MGHHIVLLIQMNIFKLSEEAFVTMGACSKCKQPFGITVDRADTRHSEYVFVWSFKINAEQAHREGYDSKNVQGAISFDDDYPGCPYCGEKRFYSCGQCGAIVCWHGDNEVTCPKCGSSGLVQEAKAINLKGGGY